MMTLYQYEVSVYKLGSKFKPHVYKLQYINFDIQSMQDKNKITFAYWKSRGLGQVCRFLLAYTDTNWQDGSYSNQQDWFEKDKSTIMMDFPNLPYLIDGDFKLSESIAIQRYIIRKSDKKDLLGKDIKDQAQVDEILGVMADLRGSIGSLFYSPDWEKKKDEMLEKARPKLEYLQKFIGKKDWVIGYLTLADFHLNEFSYYLEKMYPKEFDNFDFFKRIRDNFNKLPQIKKYQEADNNKGRPFTGGPTASLTF